MDFKIFNTLTLKEEIFSPVKKDKVTIYTCGPTVYNEAHIGNFRTYLLSDFVTRTLEYFGYEVTHAMNITDVGHLAGDGDMGVDKVEKEARESKTTADVIAQKYTDIFLADMKRLNFRMPDVMPKASEHIKEQIELIKILEQKGYTYKTSDGIYFDTSKYADYSVLSHQDLEALREGARVEVNDEKRNSTDFALWKFSSSQKGSRLQEWKSPWGIGFPGWHIECSAMSTKYLGQPFDIHLGGEDLLFPHHTNEVAQSFCAHEKPLANYWMHGRFLNIKKQKMSKSKGNFITLQTVIDRGFEPYALRYFYMTSHYRTPANFTWAALEASQVGINNLRKTLDTYKQAKDGAKVPADLDYKFKEALADDLNFPKALAIIWGLTKSGKKYTPEQKRAAIIAWDSILGLGFKEHLQDKIRAKRKFIPKEVRKYVEKREAYRLEKRFDKSDEMRDKIAELGFIIEDTEHGPVVSKG